LSDESGHTAKKSDPCIIIVAAPSGSGKSSLAKHLMTELPSIRFSVSATTRPPRAGENDGIDYHFLNEESFRDAIDQNQLLEYEEVYPGRFYGTLRSEVDRSSVNAPVLLDVDVVGALNVKESYESRCLAVFVSVPSMDELESRLRLRGTETEETLRTRIEKATYEQSFANRFDHQIMNDDLDRASAELIALVRSFLDSCEPS